MSNIKKTNLAIGDIDQSPAKYLLITPLNVSISFNIILSIGLCVLYYCPNAFEVKITANDSAEITLQKVSTKDKINKTKVINDITENGNINFIGQPTKKTAPVNHKGVIVTKESQTALRFIRLSHTGYSWNDGMGKTNADKNFLRALQKATGYKKVSKYGESHPISHLDLYPDDGFPPFVFLTGDGPIRGVSGSDIIILREYCKKGGMLIADAGSGSFDRSFRDMMRKVFPGNALIDIKDDDRIYQLPFNFTSGAPTFWSHGGRRGMGIKNNNRWMVFYHPGDMNDAWKSSGYADIKPEMRRNALNLGINLVLYAYKERNIAIAKTTNSVSENRKISKIEQELKISEIGPEHYELKEGEDF